MNYFVLAIEKAGNCLLFLLLSAKNGGKIKQKLKADMKTKLFLTGFRGAGKTSLAKLLAEKLDFELIEMDKMIVKRAGKSIAELTENGKDWFPFRLLESQVLKDIIKKENIVVATGGGLFVNDVKFSTCPRRYAKRCRREGLTFGEYNYNLVKNAPGKFIIFLKVSEKVLKERLKKGDSENYNPKWRPSLRRGKNNIEEHIGKISEGNFACFTEIPTASEFLYKNIKIYRQRLPLYALRSDFIIETSNQTPEKSLKKILELSKSF